LEQALREATATAAALRAAEADLLARVEGLATQAAAGAAEAADLRRQKEALAEVRVSLSSLFLFVCVYVCSFLALPCTGVGADGEGTRMPPHCAGSAMHASVVACSK